jgi:hypothetical protein
MSAEPVDISMPPDVWGPIFWNAMHIVSLGYPVTPTDADKDAARSFFKSLTVVLPCPVCREHYKKHLSETSLDEAVQSKGQLIHWVWDLHNRVNEMLGKPTITIDRFLENMQRMGARKCSPFRCDDGVLPSAFEGWGGIAVGAMFGILVGAGGYWYYRKRA